MATNVEIKEKAGRAGPRGHYAQNVFCDPDLGGIEFYQTVCQAIETHTHTHPEYVLGLNEAGKRGMTIKSTDYIITPGTLLLMNPDTPHRGFSVDQNPWTGRAFFMAPGTFKTLLGLEGAQEALPWFANPIERDKKTFRAFSDFFDLLQTPAARLEKETCLILLLERLVANFSTVTLKDVKGSAREEKAIHRVLAFLNDTFTEKTSLEELAAVAGFHPNYFIKVFQKNVGFTPHKYLMDLRLKRAKEQLRQGKRTVDVALESGFFDQSHMNNYFKTVHGLTPAEYQKAVRD